jgi:hypothetical protein
MALLNSIKPGITNYEAQQNWLKEGDVPGLWGRIPKWPEPGRHYFGTVAHMIGLRSGDPGPTVPGTAAGHGYDFPEVEIVIVLGNKTGVGTYIFNSCVTILNTAISGIAIVKIIIAIPDDTLVIIGAVPPPL